MSKPTRINLQTDVKPVSEFRANAAELIDQVRDSGRPLVLTQRGKPAVVVLDVPGYERLLTEIELLREARTAVAQLEAGDGVTNRCAKGELRKRFRQ